MNESLGTNPYLCVGVGVWVWVCGGLCLCSKSTDTLINIMKRFLLSTDVAKQLRDAEKAATEASANRIKAEREAFVYLCVCVVYPCFPCLTGANLFQKKY